MPSLNTRLNTASASAGGGRTGHARTSDGILEVDLATPQEMGGPGGGTNPEQLFATGYAACYQSALGVVGRREKVDTAESTVTVDVTLGTIENGAYGIAAAIKVHIPGVDPEVAQKLADAAHQVCPYSNATRGNIDVAITVE